jgi:hypothetical protein
MKVDLSGVKAGGFDPFPAGTYILALVEYEHKETGPNSKQPGSPMISAQFGVQEGEYEGRRVFNNFTFGEKALPILKSYLLSIGLTEEQLDGELDIDPEEWIGKPFKARVRIRKSEEYGDQNQISRYMAADAEDAEASSSLLP